MKLELRLLTCVLEVNGVCVEAAPPIRIGFFLFDL